MKWRNHDVRKISRKNIPSDFEVPEMAPLDFLLITRMRPVSVFAVGVHSWEMDAMHASMTKQTIADYY